MAYRRGPRPRRVRAQAAGGTVHARLINAVQHPKALDFLRCLAHVSTPIATRGDTTGIIYAVPRAPSVLIFSQISPASCCCSTGSLMAVGVLLLTAGQEGLSPAPLIDYLAQLVGQPALAPRFR